VRLAAALALVVASACRGTPLAVPTPHAVRYELVWTTDGIEAVDEERGWSVTNDLGYRVRVTRGWVTSYSMELVECAPEAAAWPLLEATAFAGHSAGTPNPAAIRPRRVESLTDPAATEAGAVTLAPQPYCKLHYLLARAGHDSPGLPADIDMVDTTLHVDGTYRAPGATNDTPFVVHTASAYGQLFDLAVVREPAAAATMASRIDTGRADTEVIVRRRLARLFDGVDFANVPAKTLALQMLRSLVDQVEVEVRRSDAPR
jgi:hypothetical protein